MLSSRLRPSCLGSSFAVLAEATPQATPQASPCMLATPCSPAMLSSMPALSLQDFALPPSVPTVGQPTVQLQPPQAMLTRSTGAPPAAAYSGTAVRRVGFGLDDPPFERSVSDPATSDEVPAIPTLMRAKSAFADPTHALPSPRRLERANSAFTEPECVRRLRTNSACAEPALAAPGPRLRANTTFETPRVQWASVAGAVQLQPAGVMCGPAAQHFTRMVGGVTATTTLRAADVPAAPGQAVRVVQAAVPAPRTYTTVTTAPSIMLPVEPRTAVVAAQPPTAAVLSAFSPVMKHAGTPSTCTPMSCSPTACPTSPTWTMVAAPQRRKGPKATDQFGLNNAAEPPPMALPASRLQTTGEAADLYYDQKELFFRGHTRQLKQSRSVKAKRQTDYQVDKRRQQSMRDKGLLDDDGYEM